MNILKQARRDYGASLRGLSKECGLSASKLFDLENGRFTRYTEDQIKKLAAFYGLPFDLVCESLGILPNDIKEKLISHPELWTFVRNYEVDNV